MGDVYGDVVEVLEPDRVWMSSGREDGTVVNVCIPKMIESLGNLVIHTDFDTARRMVEGEVSILVVVSDGECDG